ncbi:MAG: YhcH/YjgK/YiaL family protein [Eubacteriales bacterium]|nr:YhcH/YjgK/YiaL family protein [Eubacteriales bacterium]
MILDDLSHAERYEKLHPLLPAAFAFLKSLHTGKVPAVGTYPILGEELYAVVQQYQTVSPETLPFEVHRTYIDLQYLFAGQESVICCDERKLLTPTPYSAQKDCQTAFQSECAGSIPLTKNCFLLLYPGEAHKPKCILTASALAIKVVVKIKADGIGKSAAP